MKKSEKLLFYARLFALYCAFLGCPKVSISLFKGSQMLPLGFALFWGLAKRTQKIRQTGRAAGPVLWPPKSPVSLCSLFVRWSFFMVSKSVHFSRFVLFSLASHFALFMFVLSRTFRSGTPQYKSGDTLLISPLRSCPGSFLCVIFRYFWNTSNHK